MPVASKTGQVNYKLKPEKGDPGKPGAPGKLGPMLYPAGIYVIGAQTRYIRTELSAPVVLFNKQYYVLNNKGQSGEVGSDLNPQDDYAKNGNNATWVLCQKFQIAIFEAVFAAFAKLGSAIFSGDFMMSQHGVNKQGEASSDYEKFTPDMAEFIPNILLNMLTGYAHFAKGNAKFNPDGTVEIVGKFTAVDKASQTRIVIDPNSSGIKLYQADKPEPVASLSFQVDSDQVARPVLQMTTVSRNRTHYVTKVHPTIINMSISANNGLRSVQLDANRLYFKSNDVDETGQSTNHRFREFSIYNP